MISACRAALCFILVVRATACLSATCAFVPAPRIGRETEIVVLAEGDSITSGVGSSTGDRSYASLAAPLLRKPTQVINRAVSRSVLGWAGDNAPDNSLYTRRASDSALVPTDKRGRIYVLTVLIGRNDLVGYYGGVDQYLRMLADYAVSMRAAGWDRIVLGTVLPSDWAPFEAVRNAFNARVSAPCWANEHGFDAIANFAEISDMGSEAAPTQRVFYADGIHPNDAGYTAMAPVYANAIDALREPAPSP